jgi:hypothetical protein
MGRIISHNFFLVPKLLLGNGNFTPSFAWGPLVFACNLLSAYP